MECQGNDQGCSLTLHGQMVSFLPMSDDPEFTAPRHPIAVVAERTGVSPDALRMWERRYGAVAPARTPGGQRLYSDADVERLRLLRATTEAGRAIGSVASLPIGELRAMAREDEEVRRLVPRATAARAAGAGARAEGAGRAGPEHAPLVEGALACVRTLDAAGLETRLRRAAVTLGAPAFLEGVAAPLLRRVGDEWHAARLTPAQEHLATATVRRVVGAAMDALPAAPGAPTLLVATPAGERHEMGAFLAAAAAMAAGWRVVYLGPDLPAGEIALAAAGTGARAVAVGVVFLHDRDHLLAELRTLRARLATDVPLVAGGPGAVALAAELRGSRIEVAEDLDALRAVLHSAADAA